MRSASIESLGHSTVSFVSHLGRITVFIGQIGRATVLPPYRLQRVLNEVFDVGVLSLAVICSSAVVVGSTLALLGYNTMSRFGAENSLGAFLGIALIREIGPLLTGLLVTGRAGSAQAAQIASMVQTEQLDGLRMMSVEPVDFVVRPKALGMFLSMPLLNCLFCSFALFGGYLVGVKLLGLDGGVFLSSLENAVELRDDVGQTLVKSTVYGTLVGFIATYLGYNAEPTSEGVSAATTGTVVVASLAILVANYVITALWGV